MVYNDIFEMTSALSKKLYSFCGHSVNPTHASYMFDAIARGVDYMNREVAAKSICYDGEVYVDGATIPVIVTISGNDMFKPMECTISKWMIDNDL